MCHTCRCPGLASDCCGCLSGDLLASVAVAAFAERQGMSPRSTYTHGGDVGHIARQTGIPVERFLDFSANVNPMGLPRRAAERLAREARGPRLLSTYPDPEASELRCLLAERLNVPVECIIIGAGASDLIHAAVRALAPRRCLIPIPAFSEYERASKAYGCATCTVPREVLQVAEPGEEPYR